MDHLHKEGDRHCEDGKDDEDGEEEEDDHVEGNVVAEPHLHYHQMDDHHNASFNRKAT